MNITGDSSPSTTKEKVIDSTSGVKNTENSNVQFVESITEDIAALHSKVHDVTKAIKEMTVSHVFQQRIRIHWKLPLEQVVIVSLLLQGLLTLALVDSTRYGCLLRVTSRLLPCR